MSLEGWSVIIEAYSLPETAMLGVMVGHGREQSSPRSRLQPMFATIMRERQKGCRRAVVAPTNSITSKGAAAAAEVAEAGVAVADAVGVAGVAAHTGSMRKCAQ